MKIIVYEHVSGGGYAGQTVPLDVLSEGFGMLRCVVEDFKAAKHEVTVLLDSRISRLNPPVESDCTVPIFYSPEPKKFLRDIAQINDAVYVIAPETGQILQSYIELVEKTGKISLNCESQSIEKTADKTVVYETIKELGVTPKTVVLNLDDGLAKVKQKIKRDLSYPLVLKPAFGVGSIGISLVNDETQVSSAIEVIRIGSASERFIAQEFIRGEAASISLLSTGKKAMALTLNKQNVAITGSDASSRYEGGTVPFDHWLKKETFRVAERVVEAFHGLKGYVGVDVVLTEHKAFVVDINPRLTTSYVGLRKVARFNIAEALASAVVKGTLPSKPEIRGFSCFSKVETPKPTRAVFQKIAKSRDTVSPPFPLTEAKKSVALVIGEGATLVEAKLRLEEAKKRLCNIIS